MLLPKSRGEYIGIGKKAYRDLKGDLKSTRWLRGIGWFGGVLWFFGLMLSAIYICILTPTTRDIACQPDGSFRLHPETYSLWSSSGFFQITLGGGHLTFAQAKVIDVAWDIVVGRGGQFLLAFVSWRVFARYLTVCMEVQPITYQLFRTIFFEHEASLPSTYRTIKGFLWQRKLQSKTAMTFMAATMVFILAFPTLASAMSGYDANVDSYLPDREDNLIRFREFSRVLYVVHDGWRIEKDGNFWVTTIDDNYSTDPILSQESRCSYYRNTDRLDSCNDENSISEYVIAHGLGGIKNEPTTFKNWTSGNSISLEAPALNISAFASVDKNLGGQNDTKQLRPQSWMRGNESFEIAYVEGEGRCQTMGDYQWGFSYLQLFICIILLFIWTVGIYTMWLRAHFTMILRNRHPDDISGAHRAVIELAACMQYELDIHDMHPSMLREKQLEERVDKELKGGAISYAYSKADPQMYSIREGLKAWFRREKWWFFAIFVTSVLSLALSVPIFGEPWSSGPNVYLTYGAEGLWFGLWTFGPWIGQVLAFGIGTTKGSRVLIILFWSVISAIVVISWSQQPRYHDY